MKNTLTAFECRNHCISENAINSDIKCASFSNNETSRDCFLSAVYSACTDTSKKAILSGLQDPSLLFGYTQNDQNPPPQLMGTRTACSVDRNMEEGNG